MQMDEGLDTGDILLKVATPIEPGETAGSLHDRLALLAPAALLECLDRIARGHRIPRTTGRGACDLCAKAQPGRRRNRLEQDLPSKSKGAFAQ